MCITLILKVKANVTIDLYVCLIRQRAMKTYGAVNLYLRKLNLNSSGYLKKRPFTAGGRAPGIYLATICVDHTAGLGASEKESLFTLSGIEPRFHALTPRNLVSMPNELFLPASAKWLSRCSLIFVI